MIHPEKKSAFILNQVYTIWFFGWPQDVVSFSMYKILLLYYFLYSHNHVRLASVYPSCLLENKTLSILIFITRSVINLKTMFPIELNTSWGEKTLYLFFTCVSQNTEFHIKIYFYSINVNWMTSWVARWIHIKICS